MLRRAGEGWGILPQMASPQPAPLDGLQLQWLYDPSVDMRRRIQLLISLISNATEPPQKAP